MKENKNKNNSTEKEVNGIDIDNLNAELTITIELENMIRYLCYKYANKEWSGILFYKVKEWEPDCSKINIEAFDMLLMDIGTSGSTSFYYDPIIVQYQMKRGILSSDCQYGLIHSHNSMKAYFSETDRRTLSKEAHDRNHFLSLVVNNEGQYVAKITRVINKVFTGKAEYSYNSFKSKVVKYSKDINYAQKFVELISLKINIVRQKFDNIDERIEEINKKAEECRRKKMSVIGAVEESLFDKSAYKHKTSNNKTPEISPKIKNMAETDVVNIIGNFCTRPISKLTKTDILNAIDENSFSHFKCVDVVDDYIKSIDEEGGLSRFFCAVSKMLKLSGYHWVIWNLYNEMNKKLELIRRSYETNSQWGY